MDECSFQGGQYGLYSSKAESIYVTQSQFEGQLYGVAAYDIPKTHVSSSQFSATNSNTGMSVKNRGINAARTSLTTEDCVFSGSQYGIYGTDFTGVSINKCEFLDTTSHAVYCNGQSLAISNSRVVNGNYGIMLGDKTGSSAKLSDIEVEGMDIGVHANDGDYDFANVTLKDNRYGVYQRRGNSLLTVMATDSVQFSGNEYAIVTSHASDEDATLRVEGQDFSGNKSGILSYYTRVSMAKCVFEGERWGAYLINSLSVEVTDCEFNGNAANPSDCTYGLRAGSKDIQIRDSVARNASYGFYIDNLTDAPPVLRGLVSEHNAYAGMYIRNGTWTYTDADRNVFRNCDRGVIASNMRWSVTDATPDDSCNYAIMDYDGELTIDGAVVSGKTVGVYSYRSAALDVSKLSVSNCGSYGVYVYQCADTTIDHSSFTSNRTGIYVAEANNKYAKITNSRFANNASYGILLSGSTLDPSIVANLTIEDNQYGISVSNQPLTLTKSMDVTITGNRYGVRSSGSQLTLQDMSILDNEVGIYTYDGDLIVENSTLSGSLYGILAYPSNRCEIVDSTFTDAAYGIAIRPRATLSTPIKITGTTVSNSGSYGIYVYDSSGTNPTVNVSDSLVSNCRYGILASGVDVAANSVTVENTDTIGFYLLYGTNTLKDCIVDNAPNSWGHLHHR